MPWRFIQIICGGGWGESLEVFLEVCCTWDRPCGVDRTLIFICRWAYLLQLPSVCLCISFIKVINSLDFNLKDLLAVPFLHFNWLPMNWGFHQHMLSYRTGNYGWRHFVGGCCLPQFPNIACTGGGEFTSTSLEQNQQCWVSQWEGPFEVMPSNKSA